MKKIILAGGGHGHINILKQLVKKPLPHFEITLISDFKRQYYSGMLPGFLEGIYTEEEISFDIPALCKKAGVRFIHEPILEINGAEKSVLTESQQFHYDFLSMNLGSRSREDFEIGDREAYVKPISSIVKFLKVLDEKLVLRSDGQRQRSKPFSDKSASSQEKSADMVFSSSQAHHLKECSRKKLIMVGGGASGVELSIALHARYDNLDIEIITSNRQLIPLFNAASRKYIENILKQKEILFRTSEKVCCIQEQSVVTEKGLYPYDFLMISTGFIGCDILFKGFELTAENFVLVDEHLRADAFSVAMGDMVTLRHYPQTHKAGVFAIRQAPVLYKNLMKLIRAENDFNEYHPQKNYLQLINTGRKTAVFNKASLSFHGKTAWLIKDFIDRKYIKK